jgi:hypothetical protein
LCETSGNFSLLGARRSHATSKMDGEKDLVWPPEDKLQIWSRLLYRKWISQAPQQFTSSSSSNSTLSASSSAVVPLCVCEREREKRRAARFSSTLSAIFPAAVVLLITRHSSRPGNHFIERLQFERCRDDAVSLI